MNIYSWIAGGALRTRGAVRRRGTAMIEFVFCVPLLALVLALTFFFGYLMKNQQAIKAADRYATWRDVYNPNPTPSDVNNLLFAGRAVNMQVYQRWDVGDPTPAGYTPGLTLDEWVTASTAVSPEAGSFAQSTIHDRFPHHYGKAVVAEFPSTVGAWQQFNGPVSSHQIDGDVMLGHAREGVEWRRTQAGISETIREQYLQTLDAVLLGIPSPGDGMAQMIRRLYVNGW